MTDWSGTMRFLVPLATVGAFFIWLCTLAAPSVVEGNTDAVARAMLVMIGVWIVGGVLGTVSGIVRHGRVAGVLCASFVTVAAAGMAYGVQSVQWGCAAKWRCSSPPVDQPYDIHVLLLGAILFGLPFASIAIGFSRSRIVTGGLLLLLLLVTSYAGYFLAYPWRLAK